MKPSQSIREDFFSKIGHDAGFTHLFDRLDQVAFFLKNEQFQFVEANRHFFERLGLRHEDEIIGRDDFELFPRPLAKKFRHDDEQVLLSGIEMREMVELFLSRQGLPDWFITNKMPVRDRKGRPVGIMGTVQRYNQKGGLTSSDPAIARAVSRILEEPGEIVSLTDLARELGMSYRHFDRRFKEETGLTPKQFLVRSRIQKGCLMLQKDNTPIADVALDLGYCDQSAFTAQFRRRMGLTPHRYRREFGK